MEAIVLSFLVAAYEVTGEGGSLDRELVFHPLARMENPVTPFYLAPSRSVFGDRPRVRDSLHV
jgi:hypothetical protein